MDSTDLLATEFQYPLWLVTFLILAVICPGLYAFSPFFSATITSVIVTQYAHPSFTLHFAISDATKSQCQLCVVASRLTC